ncbi:hypothetical protein NLJ89_g10993 [Agrocybe chaxingu]|uniref:Uncharacterized protein n=1 Tax=Agrocybe chaxingu TaxID=84603 RepID=A0A9W8MPS3_9AGAR|nr:hypothetical protein NLJ89_g10993 [Agrocybe chaxingu]
MAAAFKTFLEWNSDREIADAAEKLYGNIDLLELYVGLQAEEAKPLVDGAGLCPGYTVSRAILSDAIALTRGDRFFTHDFTPFNLTSWGFADCQRDPDAFGFGSMLGRLFLRTLPDHFTENSTYTFFPLMTPESMEVILKNLEVADQYDLSRPKYKSAPVFVEGYSRVSAVLKNKEGFTTPYKTRVDRVIQGPGFFPVEDQRNQQAIIKILTSPEHFDDIGQYFYTMTKKLIDEKSYALVGGKTSGVDLVRQVVSVLPAYWVATDLASSTSFGGGGAGIELKTKEHPSGTYTPQELYEALGEIYEFIFLDIEASRVMVLEDKVKEHIKTLLRLINGGLNGALSFTGIIGTVSSMFSKPKSTEYHDIVKRLYELGDSTDQLANTILALMVTAGTELVIAITNTLNVYLGSDHAPTLTALANKKGQFDAYVYEVLRIDPTFQGVFRISTKDQVINGQSFKKNDRVFLNIASANLDEKVFPDPFSVNLTRPAKDRLSADGVFNYLGEGLTVKIVSEVLRAVFEYTNVRRAPGQSGNLKRFKNHSRPELCYSYLSTAQLPSEWPTSMSIQYDTPRK